MIILYLTEDYFASKVHNNLIVKELEQDETLRVYVFSPVRDENRKSLSASFKQHERLHVIAPKIDISLRQYRLNFWAKIRCKVRLIESSLPINQIDCIHAATLYSEGAVALALKKKYQIPYLVSMRGCDAMTYTRKMPHLWCKGNSVLRNADLIASVTPAIKQKMLNSWQYMFSRSQLKKCLVLNNGIDDIWLQNIHNEVADIGTPFKIAYVGRFDNNKNVLRLIDAVKLSRKDHNISLVLIGGKGEEHDRVLVQVKHHGEYIEYLGEIYDKDKLMRVIRSCDMFAMASHSETFGLVYAECLTQGLPLLYTAGTGFDDMYPQGYIGYGVDSHSAKSISDAINNVISNYKVLRQNISKLDYSIYSWNEIIKKYLELYNSIK